MSDLNSLHNRAVWFDIPVADLDRAATFYAAVLAIKVQKESFGAGSFCVFEHENGNGGCLVEGKDQIAQNGGVLLYLNVEGRIKDALGQVPGFDGQVLEPTVAIGPHGFRAVVRDSEGNRIALHSTTDA